MRSRRVSGPSEPQGDLGLSATPDGVPVVDDARPRRAAATPGATAESAVAISTLTQTAKAVLEGAFQPLWIRGEVSNFTAHRNGHWYFTLKDQESQLRCVVWRGDTGRIPAMPDDGMEVCAFGRLSMYTARGEIQFVASRLEAAGEGLWRKAFELARRKLEADGLLEASRKRPLPLAPRRIAFITSASGAAFHDVVAVTRRRSPGTELVLIPAQVQGEGAVDSLIAALDLVARWRDCELVIIGRGGGSREDLWCFNDERLCRAVAACPIPTISAIGHEVDVTLVDLVADWRAPTPSAAAERAVPDHLALVSTVVRLGQLMRASLERRARKGRQVLARTGVLMQASLERRARYGRQSLTRTSQLIVASFDRRTRRGRQALVMTGRHLSLTSRQLTERAAARLGHAAARLEALSPLATLARGYAVARDTEGHALVSASRFAPGFRFRLVLRDGEVQASTIAVTPGAPVGAPSRARIDAPGASS